MNTDMKERPLEGGTEPQAKVLCRILHLEDNPSDRLLVQEELKKAGINCEIRCINSREEFCSSIGKGGFDIIVSDSSLPSFDGLEALTISRAQAPDIPFIVFSGGIKDDPRGVEIRKAATAVIPKTRLEDLVHTVREIYNPPSQEPISAEAILKGIQWPGEAVELFRFLEADEDFGILAFDQERRITAWNRELERLYGLPQEEAVGRPVTQVLMKLGRNGEDLLLYSIIEGIPMNWRESSHVHRQSNLPMTVRTSLLPLRNSKNVPAGGIALFRNISVQKRMAQAGMVVENAFRSAVEGAADAILITDREGKILIGNKKLSRMLNQSSLEIASKSVSDLLDDAGKRNWALLPGEVLRTGGETFLTTRIRRNQGSELEAELSVSLISGGKMMIVIRDISDRILENKQLMQSKDLFISLAKGAREIVVAVSRERSVLFVNDAFTAITGWSKWIWLGGELTSLVHPDDAALWRYNLSSIEEGEVCPVFQIRLRAADGRYLRGECSCSPVLQNGEVTGVWHIIRSVDEPFFPDKRSAQEFTVVSEQYASMA